MSAIRPIPPGEPAPWFIRRSLTNPHCHFNTMVLFFAGRRPGDELRDALPPSAP